MDFAKLILIAMGFVFVILSIFNGSEARHIGDKEEVLKSRIHLNDWFPKSDDNPDMTSDFDQNENWFPYQDSCSSSCSKLKRLVCGSDGRTYFNPCQFLCAKKLNPSLIIVHQGAC